jgi:hypothetical protein
VVQCERSKDDGHYKASFEGNPNMKNYRDFADWVDAVVATGEDVGAFVTREAGPYRALFEAGYSAEAAVIIVQTLRQRLWRGMTLACGGGMGIGVAIFYLMMCGWHANCVVTPLWVVSAVMVPIGALCVLLGLRMVNRVKQRIQWLEDGEYLKARQELAQFDLQSRR